MQPFAELQLPTFMCRADKSPAIAGGYKSAAITTPQTDWPLIGIPVPAGVIILDIDSHKGMTTDRVEKALGWSLNWSDALLQHTRNGGAHYAFKCDSVDSLRHGSDLFADQIGNGFDTRCGGRGYICSGIGYTDVKLWMLSPLMQYMLPELSASAVAALTTPVPVELPTAPPVATVSVSELRSALAALPDEYATDRQQWFEVSCGIKAALGDDAGWPLFDEFSQRCPEKYDRRANYHQWQSIKPQRDYGANIGADTIFYHARKNGWVGDLASIGFGQAPLSAPVTPATWAMPVSLADVMTDAAPPRFVTADILPAGTTTLLSANGGTGKSQLALQWAVCVALGQSFFGKQTEQQRVLFYSAEDGGDVLRYRLRKICKQMNIEPAALADNLLILDATEIDATLYSEDTRTRMAGTTPNYDKLAEAALQHRAGMIIVDNASDVFGASENERAKVRGFLRGLNQLAKRTGAATLLLSHVDKATARGGAGDGSQGYSGSTGWRNSVRSHLFMCERDGRIELQHQKSNHARRADTLTMIFDVSGVLVPVIEGMGGDSATRHFDETQAVLSLVAEFTARGEYVSTATAGRNSARCLLGGQPGFPARFRQGSGIYDCLRNAERAHLIRRVKYQTRYRNQLERWEVSGPPDFAA